MVFGSDTIGDFISFLTSCGDVYVRSPFFLYNYCDFYLSCLDEENSIKSENEFIGNYILIFNTILIYILVEIKNEINKVSKEKEIKNRPVVLNWTKPILNKDRETKTPKKEQKRGLCLKTIKYYIFIHISF